MKFLPGFYAGVLCLSVVAASSGQSANSPSLSSRFYAVGMDQGEIHSAWIKASYAASGNNPLSKLPSNTGPAERKEATASKLAARYQRRLDNCAFTNEAPGTTGSMVFSGLAGVEQVASSSLPSQTEPFVRLFIQSGQYGCLRLWGSFRILGAPNQSDTSGIFSVFTDPTGQITSEKLSSVGTAVDFAIGPSYRLFSWSRDTNNSVDLILGFGATTPLQSNKVTQAFTAPVFGTAECNILYNKFAANFAISSYGVQKSTTGIATGSSSACLLNTNAQTVANGNATFAPIGTIAFSNPDRTSFLLKDLLGVRFNHTQKTAKECTLTDACYLGTLDFTFGQDSAITGGVLRGNRWLFKADGVYPLVVKDLLTLYVFGSFSTRIERNSTDNTPLILQAATLTTVTASGSSGVPNVNTIVLPLKQPDRDFYRIGVGIDVMSLFKPKKAS